MTSPRTNLDVPLPQPRRFGSSTPLKPSSPHILPRPGSSSSNHSNTSPNTSTTNLSTQLLAPEPQRTRSSSSASNDLPQRATAWLSTWAPKGEGRGREFLGNALTGVQGVATTVGAGIGGVVVGVGAKIGEMDRERRQSFYNGVGTSGIGFEEMVQAGTTTPPPPRIERSGSTTEVLSTSIPTSPSPAPLQAPLGPQHSLSSPALSNTKRIPQPANLSRLGQTLSNTSDPALIPARPNTTTSNSYPLPDGRSNRRSSHHGPSHLNPNMNITPKHTRQPSGSGSSFHAGTSPNVHTRTHSFGAGGQQSPGLSRSSSTAGGNGNGTSFAGRSAGMPYKIGFQPAGVKVDKSGEYVDARRRAGEEREKEEGRLGRRWAKLVDLHFNPTTVTIPNLPTLSRSPSSSLSLASNGNGDKRRSLLSIDGALDVFRPREMWKGVKGTLGPSGPAGAEEARKRAAEQAIVKWEDDGEVKKCRICQSVFSLSNRKHHCRLCGRIICSLPPTPPTLLQIQITIHNPTPSFPSSSTFSSPSTPTDPLPPGTRREACSLLLVADWKSGRGEIVEEGFIGWVKTDDVASAEERRLERRKSRSSMGSVSTFGSGSIGLGGIEEDGGGSTSGSGRRVPLPQQPKEVQVKGMRACRECWAVVSRKQKMADRAKVTGFARLYQALRALQAEIEDLMPDFEEQMDILTSSYSSNSPEPPPSLLNTHKTLLSLFAQYDHLSKRVSHMSCPEGSSQSQVQAAVGRSAAMFLAREMVKVQALPRLQKKVAESKRKNNMNTLVLETTLAEQLRSEGVNGDKADDAALLLQPLLEQEAQLEVMVADAKAQRKYEDGKALGEALSEIRLEIERVAHGVMT